MSLAFLYPGQGSQRPDMLRALPASPAVTRTLDEAALELDHTRWPAGLDDLDTAEALQSTTNVQLALLISGVAAARALTDDRGLVPAFVAGHSVGAFAAAVTAGVLTFAKPCRRYGARRSDAAGLRAVGGGWRPCWVCERPRSAHSPIASVRLTIRCGSPTSMPPTRSSCPAASQRSSEPRPPRVRPAPVDGSPST